MNKHMQKVIVGMSGGVDSSVAAALLVEQGYEVVGVFMKNWHSNEARFNDICPWEEDLRDAKAVAARLDIPLLVWNFEKEYYDHVVEYLLKEYQAGRTPNPDVMCNKEIKFKVFLDKALAEGADYIATGHYARIITDAKGQTNLFAGLDPNKDQSYFLYAIDHKVLPQLKMPIGAFKKTDIRQLAKTMQLPNWDKKDSQGICFIGKINLKEFLATKLPVNHGDIVTTGGEVIGRHDGVWFYTEGQREGLGLKGGTSPYYVVSKDITANRLIVGLQKAKELFSDSLVAGEMNWLSDMPKQFDCLARIRYRSPLAPCQVKIISPTGIEVKFDSPERAVAQGQSIVLYRDDGMVLGGGVIA